MGKRVRITEDYYDQSMVGSEAIIIKDKRLDKDSCLIGFPLDSPFGWYESDYTTEYHCWWIPERYIEPITTITRSKFI